MATCLPLLGFHPPGAFQGSFGFPTAAFASKAPARRSAASCGFVPQKAERKSVQRSCKICTAKPSTANGGQQSWALSALEAGSECAQLAD